jgi:hypothetical protein
VEPSAPYVTETKRGASGARRSIELHSVASIGASVGGKNSNDTAIGVLLMRAPCGACGLERRPRDRRDHVLAVGLERA